MKSITRIVCGVFVIAVGGVLLNSYINYKDTQADTDACNTLRPEQAADAVIRDVIRPDNKQFAQYHLSESDVKVDPGGIQFGPLNALVPFSLSISPEVRHFGMPRCSVLTDVEYGN